MIYRWLTITAFILFIFFITNDINAQKCRNENRHNQNSLEKLNLSDAQKEKFNALKLNHREEMIKLHSELELKQLELEKMKSSENFSSSGYVNAVKEISIVRSKMAEARAEHRMDIYEILDDNQKKTFLSFPEQSGRKRISRHYRHRDM